MRILVLFALVIAWQHAHAEVYKCTGKDGKTVYQSKPCQTAVKAEQLDIQADPEVEAAAKARREALESEYDAKKAAKLEAERRDAVLRNQTESAAALKQSAIAHQQQVEAQQRQAAALERQAQQGANRVMIVAPPAVLPAPAVSSQVPGVPVPSGPAVKDQTLR